MYLDINSRTNQKFTVTTITNGTITTYGPLARYAKLPVAHAPGMPGTFSLTPRVSDPDMHHGTCVMHVPWCISVSLTTGFLWGRCRGKRSRHSRCMRLKKVSEWFGYSDKSIDEYNATKIKQNNIFYQGNTNPRFSAKLQYLKFVSNGDPVVLH